MVRSSLAIIALVVVNLVPLFGVLFFGWSLFSIMLLYWFENGIVGFFNLFKIGLARAPMPEDFEFRINGRPTRRPSKLFLIPFFMFHYGLFWTVHGVFVVVLFGVFNGSFGAFGDTPELPDFGGGFRDFDPTGTGIAALALVLSHGLSFFVNFVGEREYENVSPAQQMFRPYGRVVVLHATIIGGGYLVARLGEPVAALALMVALKIGIDLVAHTKEHRKARKTPAAAGAS